MTNAALQLADLLADPRESLDVEIKSWLQLADKEHAGVLAKAVIALANYGGGTLILGFVEDPVSHIFQPAPNRPPELTSYGQDAVNSIVTRHLEPNIHCDVHMVTRAADALVYPVVRIPASTVPVRSKIDSPSGSIRNNVYYVRRPGPKSEQASTGKEWDDLIRRCVTSNRAALLDAVRGVLSGVTPVGSMGDTSETMDGWLDASWARWRARLGSLPTEAPARFPHGYFLCAYELGENVATPPGSKYVEILEQAPRHTGWRPFLVIHRDDMKPVNVEGSVEAWLGNASARADHSDFWRASRTGRFFLARGHQEDTADFAEYGPGKVFDLTLPVWRVAECLLHARYMCEKLGGDLIRTRFDWTGLAGRQLVSHRRGGLRTRHALQDVYTTTITTTVDEIDTTLPEVVGRIVAPLFELFDFFALPSTLPAEEIGKMLGRR